MDTAFTKKFRRQLNSCKDKRIRKRVLSVIEEATAAESLSDLKAIKKLSGAKNCFRVRVGDYRIGLVFDQDTLIFAAFDHRSDIYKYFPKLFFP